MDIGSLLSPQETPQPSPAGSNQPGRKTTRKPRNGKPAKASPATSSGPIDQAAPVSQTSASAQRPAPTPLMPSPASGTKSSATTTPPADGPTRPFRQPSTPGMDTLADLASMQHDQQTARVNAGGLRSTEIYDSPASAPTSVPNIRNVTSQETALRLRTPSFDHKMVDPSQHAPKQRPFFSRALSDSKLQAVKETANDIQQNPFAYNSHVHLINMLHQGLMNHINAASEENVAVEAQRYELLQELRNAREVMSSRFAVGEDLWVDWLEDQIVLTKSLEDKLTIRELCEQAVAEESASIKIWLVYGRWMVQQNNALVDGTAFDHRGSAPGQLSLEEEKAMYEEMFGWQQVLHVWQRAADETLWRINDSNQTWDQYTEFLVQNLGPSPSKEAVTNIQQRYVERLQIPHSTWDQTSQALSTLISTYDQANWESVMVTANRMGADAKKNYELRDMKELQIAAAVRDQDLAAEYQAYEDYVEFEMSYNRKRHSQTFELTNAVFQRALLRFPAQSDLWELYVNFLNKESYQHGRSDIPILKIFEKATRHCPWSGNLWAQKMLAAEITGLSFPEIGQMKHRATSRGISEIGNMDELLKVTVAWCGFLKRRAFMPGSTDEELDVAEVGIRSAIEDLETEGHNKYGKSYQGDPEYRIEKLYIECFAQTENWSAARDVFRKLVRRKGHDYEFWLHYYGWEMRVWASRSQDSSDSAAKHPRPTDATRVLQQALKRTDLNWTEKILQTYLQHCEDYEDATQLQHAIVEVWHQTRQLSKKREKEAEQYQTHANQKSGGQHYDASQIAEAPTETLESLGKRKREDGTNSIQNKKSRAEELPMENISPQPQEDQPEPVKRDRENATIIVRNLPPEVSSAKIRQYFRDCGVVNSLKITRDENTNTSIATIEFQSKEDGLTAKTKDMKMFDDHAIEIQIGTGSTLYVCNFPPTADESLLREWFDPFGSIIDIRFPSLSITPTVDSPISSSSYRNKLAQLLALDGKTVGEGLQLLVKESDPAHKQQRQGAMYEGRELFVSNVPWNVDWKALKQHFAQYGSVESARLLKKFDGSSKGLGFVVFRHKEDAERALSLNGTEWHGRRLVVAESTNDTAKRQNVAMASTSQRNTTSPPPEIQAVARKTPNGDGQASASTVPGNSTKKEEIQSRTLAILNIPDTVNDARIRALVEPYGEIVKLLLRPNHQGAIVEFKDQSSVGKASLALEGHEIAPGRDVSIGSVDDLKRLRAEWRSDKIGSQPRKEQSFLPAQSQVRRPGHVPAKKTRRSALAINGAALAAHGQKSSTSEATSRGTLVNGGKSGNEKKGRSNADFQALFSGGDKAEEKVEP